MHVTLNIDDDVLETAIRLAEDQKRPVDSIISDLVRRGMTISSHLGSNDERPLPASRFGGRRVTTEFVKQIQEEFDMEDALKAMGK